MIYFNHTRHFCLSSELFPIQTKFKFTNTTSVLYDVPCLPESITLIKPFCSVIGTENPQYRRSCAFPDSKCKQLCPITFILLTGQDIKVFNQTAVNRHYPDRLPVNQHIELCTLCNFRCKIIFLAFRCMTLNKGCGTDISVRFFPAFGMNHRSLHEI